MQKIDSHTVRFVTEKPDPVFEQRLATYASWIVSHKHWNRYKTDDPKWMQKALNEVTKVLAHNPDNAAAVELKARLEK